MGAVISFDMGNLILWWWELLSWGQGDSGSELEVSVTGYGTLL